MVPRQQSAKTPKPAAPAADKQAKRKYHVPRARRPWMLVNALIIGVCSSVAVHAMLSALNFTVPELKLAKQQDRGLEIVLVNAKHAQKPKNAQALAQANLDGGGNVEQKAMPTSPLPPENANREGDSLIETQRRVQQLERAQRELMTKALASAKVNVDRNTPTETPPAENPAPSALDLRDQARAIARQEAVIDRQLREYAQRPRKQFVGARTQEYRFAQYVEDWRAKIERVGTLNFPKSAGSKLYGSVLVSVEISYDGSIISKRVERSSGNKALDEHALRILQLSSPFAAFPDTIRKDTDVLVVTRTWTFINEKVTTE
ncbi:MAG: energy transducer TonB [Moraxellaceae bacterium]|nr:energy transducer TonB [Moraxellaceae bacterium]